MLSNITKQLTSLRSKREQAERELAELDAPRKRLEAILAEEREIEAQKAGIDRQIAATEAELATVSTELAELERLEAVMITARDALAQMEDSPIVSYQAVQVSRHEINKMVLALRLIVGQPKTDTLHYEEGLIVFRRNQRDQLTKRLRELRGK